MPTIVGSSAYRIRPIAEKMRTSSIRLTAVICESMRAVSSVARSSKIGVSRSRGSSNVASSVCAVSFASICASAIAASFARDALYIETAIPTTSRKASHPQRGRRCRLAREPNISFLSHDRAGGGRFRGRIGRSAALHGVPRRGD